MKVVELDAACRQQQVDEGHFPDRGDVPAQAMTVTIPALLRAARVLAIVPEARKAEPVRAALEGPVTTACPASALRTDADAVLHLEPASARLLAGADPPAAARTSRRPRSGFPRRVAEPVVEERVGPSPVPLVVASNTSWSSRSPAPKRS